MLRRILLFWFGYVYVSPPTPRSGECTSHTSPGGALLYLEVVGMVVIQVALGLLFGVRLAPGPALHNHGNGLLYRSSIGLSPPPLHLPPKRRQTLPISATHRGGPLATAPHNALWCTLVQLDTTSLASMKVQSLIDFSTEMGLRLLLGSVSSLARRQELKTPARSNEPEKTTGGVLATKSNSASHRVSGRGLLRTQCHAEGQTAETKITAIRVGGGHRW